MIYEPSAELSDLLGALLDDEITVDESDRLAEILSVDVDARAFYRELIETHSMMVWQRRAVAAPPGNSSEDASAPAPDPNPIIASASLELGNSTSNFNVPLSPFSTAFGYFSSGWPVAYLIATVIFGIGLVVGMVVHVSQPYQYVDRSGSVQNPGFNSSPVVARLTGQVDCIWEGSGFRVQDLEATREEPEIIDQKSLLRLGDRLTLRSGLLEITYDTGAKVILQGPVTYDVESPAGGYLSIGKLTAKLEQRSEVRDQRSDSANHPSEIINHKFVVRTPTAVVTDLGTEFGVEVDQKGVTTSHVFRGSVRVQRLSADGSGADPGQVLRENQSSSVARDGGREVTVVQGVKPTAFVREIPKQAVKTFDLVDVVAGGNGFSGRRDRGIDPLTGRVVHDTRIASPSQEFEQQRGDYRYHRVTAVPFVDGVFIPQADKGPVQLDSEGHAFDGFVTYQNLTSGYTWAGSSIFNDREGRTKLCGVDYASPGHGLLSIHANQGITFDLIAIRRSNPGWKPVRFRAALANPETGCDQGLPTMADAWVFVDGQMRTRFRQINGYSGALPVNIPIEPHDRFLTLVATDGGNSIDHDWVIFGDPRLELKKTSDSGVSGNVRTAP